MIQLSAVNNMAPKVKILSHLIVGILSCIAVAIAQTSTPDNTSTTTKTTLPPTTSVIVTTTRSTPTATPSPIPVNEGKSRFNHFCEVKRRLLSTRSVHVLIQDTTRSQGLKYFKIVYFLNVYSRPLMTL